MSLVTFEEVKQFVVAHYKHSRLYGRNNASGWEDAYGDNIVKGYLDSLNDVHNTTPCLISLHESNTGTTVSFNRSDIIQYHYEQFSRAFGTGAHQSDHQCRFACF